MIGVSDEFGVVVWEDPETHAPWRLEDAQAQVTWARQHGLAQVHILEVYIVPQT